MRFLLLGSGEFEPWTHVIEERALGDADGDGSVVILPTASARDGEAVFERWGRMGVDHYAEVGRTATALPVRTREDAMREDLAAAAESASMIYCSGGKPQHLADVLRDTPLLAAITRAMERGAVYAGCSAGAMVASRARDGARGNSWLFGLGLVPHASFGAHWDRLRKIPGAAWWMTSRLPDDTWFVGIDERTAIWGDGTRWEVAGLGTVHVRRGEEHAVFATGSIFETG
ncbi:MAG: Type 1 glutamine amidotransferase-like domain-containing protein [Actinomycetota bacterium]